MQRTPSPSAERSVAPYGAVRKRGSRDFDDVDVLRQVLDATLQQQMAWEQEVQQQVFSPMENEKGMARTALHEYRLAGSEAIERESEQARARLAESQE